MVIDFFQQTAYSSIFFLGIAGMGLIFLKLLKFKEKNIFLSISISYFISLCFYTVVAAYFLFFVEDKLLFLTIFTISYFWASFVLIFFFYFQKRKLDKMKLYFKNNWAILTVLIFIIFVFFLQIYQTSIIDEWLHRPVVKFFTENGEFPLKDPFSPSENFIYNYHYGSYLSVSAIQLIFKSEVSESLDLFKLSYVIGTILLFYGLVLHWGGSKKYALLGSILVFFCGGSFFFLDGFTINYFSNIKWLERTWAINNPISYILTGITYVNIPMIFAFSFLAETLFKKKIFYSTIPVLAFSILVVGFFLIGEFFAVIFLFFVFILTLISILKKEIGAMKAILLIIVGSIVMTGGIYFSGGVMGNIIKSKTGKFLGSLRIEQFSFENKSLQSSLESSNVVNFPTSKWISLKKISDWGYPSEKRIIYFKDNLFFYLRNLFLEAILVILIIWALIKKKIRVSDNYCLFFMAIIGILGPFVFSSSMGDLNFTKLLNVGLVSLHLLTFYILLKTKLKKITVTIIILFVFGSIPGMAVGSGIQWGIFKGKAREVRCSQNPLCYKKEVSSILVKFEKENPGLKYVLNNGGSEAQKIVDLTNSYSVVALGDNLSYDYLRENKVGFIFKDLKSKGKLDVSELENSGKATKILNNSRYEIFKVN